VTRPRCRRARRVTLDAALAGIAAKIRIAAMLPRGFSARDSIENRLLASALRDLERLAAGQAD
jgi:hypothetical protein